MTEAEVAAILGGPPGYYNDRNIAPVVADGAVYELIKAGEPKEWRGNRWWILVFFDDQGRVLGKSLNPCIAWPDTFWGKLNSWLGYPVFLPLDPPVHVAPEYDAGRHRGRIERIVLAHLQAVAPVSSSLFASKIFN
jgi:hypothetical protein